MLENALFGAKENIFYISLIEKHDVEDECRYPHQEDCKSPGAQIIVRNLNQLATLASFPFIFQTETILIQISIEGILICKQNN